MKRILGFYASQMKRKRLLRASLRSIDSLLAATAAAHGLELVIRNTKEVASLRVEASNPWIDR